MEESLSDADKDPISSSHFLLLFSSFPFLSWYSRFFNTGESPELDLALEVGKSVLLPSGIFIFLSDDVDAKGENKRVEEEDELESKLEVEFVSIRLEDELEGDVMDRLDVEFELIRLDDEVVNRLDVEFELIRFDDEVVDRLDVEFELMRLEND